MKSKPRKVLLILVAIPLILGACAVGYFGAFLHLAFTGLDTSTYKSGLRALPVAQYPVILDALQAGDMDEVKELIYVKMMTDIAVVESGLEVQDKAETGVVKDAFEAIAIHMSEHPYELEDEELNRRKEIWIKEHVPSGWN